MRSRKKRRGCLPVVMVLALLVLGGALLYQHKSQGETIEALENSGTSLIQEIRNIDKLSYIRKHPEEYTPKLLELAKKNPEAVEFVYNYPKQSGQSQEIDLREEAAGDQVPLLLQWDSRWGYNSYSGGLMGYTGCGPTCLSMVALYLTGNPAYSPAYVAEYAQTNGYVVDGSGTSWTLMSQGSAAFGLAAEELPLDEGYMKNALDGGRPLICVLGPGDFTDEGHFIVVTGWDGDGFTVNDPNSVQRSGRHWTFSRLQGQILDLWAFSGSGTAQM